MKTFILILFFVLPNYCFSQNLNVFSEFHLVFGEGFRNDLVSVKIAGVNLANNVRLESGMIGFASFSIDQNKSGLNIFLHGEDQKRKKIPVGNMLEIYISVNNIWRRFAFDLTKGKILYAQYNSMAFGWTGFKVLTIKQQTHPAVFF